MKATRILAVCAASALFAGIASSAVRAQEFNWKLYTFFGCGFRLKPARYSDTKPAIVPI